jgi:hypothetical protein
MKLLGTLLRVVESLTLLALRIMIGLVTLLARGAIDTWRYSRRDRFPTAREARALNPPQTWRNPWHKPPRRRRRRRSWTN